MGDEPCSAPPLAQRAVSRVTQSEEPNNRFICAEQSTRTLSNSTNSEGSRKAIPTPWSSTARDLVFPEWEATDLRQLQRDLQ